MSSSEVSAVQMRDFAMKVFAVDPDLCRQRLPINKALSGALEKAEMIVHYSMTERTSGGEVGWTG